MGTEIYWHGLLDYDNRDNRKIRELKEFGEILAKIPETAGAEYLADFAILRDYDNVWDSEVDHWHGRLAWKSEEEIFVAAQLTHTPMDYLYLQESTTIEELLNYKVLVYPHALILTESRTKLLEEYCRRGGTLVIGARTGQKELTGKCVMTPMPGLLADLTHTQVDDYTFVGPADGEVCLQWGEQAFSSGVFNDVLAPMDDTVKVLAVYRDNYYSGAPSLTERAVGEGRVLHFGGTFTREFFAALGSYLEITNPWSEYLELPEGCELCVRRKGEQLLFFVLNFQSTAQKIVRKQELKNLLTGTREHGEIQLAPYEVQVYTL